MLVGFIKSRKIKLSTLLLVSLLSLLISAPASAVDRFREYEVKAAFLYNLTNFIYWPQESFNDTNNAFKIVILGNDPFGQSLKKLVLNELVGSHPIEITYIDTIEEFTFAHLLYISAEHKQDIRKIIPLTRQLGLLSVSDFNGFNELGGGISLLNKNKRLELHLSENVLEYNGLRCSSKLLQLATIVKGAL